MLRFDKQLRLLIVSCGLREVFIFVTGSKRLRTGNDDPGRGKRPRTTEEVDDEFYAEEIRKKVEKKIQTLSRKVS